MWYHITSTSPAHTQKERITQSVYTREWKS